MAISFSSSLSSSFWLQRNCISARLIRRAVVVLGFVLALILASLTHAQGPMHRVQITDPSFGMSAYTLEIPARWRFESSLRRDVGCSPGDPFQAYRVTSSDGTLSIQVMTPFFTAFPAQFAQGMDFSKCGVITQAMPTARLLTRYIVPAIRRDARVIGAPEPTEDQQKWVQQNAQRFQMYSTSGDTSRVKVAYTENGKAVEEWIAGLTLETRYRQGGGFSKTVVVTMRAPAGHLQDVEKAMKWAFTVTANPEWQQRELQRAQQAQALSQQNGQQQRNMIAAQTQDNMNATVARTQSTIDGIHATGDASMKAARDSENARHSAAVGTADYAGDRPTQYYRWRNTITGATQTTNNPTNPGPNWISY